MKSSFSEFNNQMGQTWQKDFHKFEFCKKLGNSVAKLQWVKKERLGVIKIWNEQLDGSIANS